MLRVAIIEDDIEQLVGVIRSLMALKQHRRDFEMVPVLLSNPNIDTPEAIADWSEEEREPLRNAGVDDSDWPKIEQLGMFTPLDDKDRERILNYLAEQNVQAIVSDSWMGRDTDFESRFSESDLKLSGVRLLDAAEKDERWKGKCWLMTKFGNDVMSELLKVAGWRPEVFNPLNFEDYRYIDKSKVHDVIPGEWERQLERVIEEGVARMKLTEPIKLPPEVAKEARFGRMIGSSKGMQKVYTTILQVANTDATVLILGEVGTGKELIACELHQRSKRARKRMVDINCAEINKDLVSSELFGHEPGAFTSAAKMKRGLFEVADGSTLFLDEIGEIPLDTQAALLRAIQQREIRRVGGDRNIPIDVRIIAATNQSLIGLMKVGRFREDLYSRLEVIIIEAPPLRDRREDIRLLIEHFIEKFNETYKASGKHVSGVSSGAFTILENYDWPRNVRQLENVIEAAFLQMEGTQTLNEENPKINGLIALSHPPDAEPTKRSREPSNSSRRYKSHFDAWQAIEEGRDIRTLDEWDIELGIPETFDVIELLKEKRFGRYPKPEETQKLFGMTYGAFKGWIFRNKKFKAPAE